MKIEKKDYKKINELKISRSIKDTESYNRILNDLLSKYDKATIDEELKTENLYIIEWFKAYEN